MSRSGTVSMVRLACGRYSGLTQDIRKRNGKLAGQKNFGAALKVLEPSCLIAGGVNRVFSSEVADSVTTLLDRLRDGDRSALDPLVAVVYPELRRIAAAYLREERPSHVIQPTVLVHEAYLRLVGIERPDYQDRAHFFGTVAGIMRHILVDHARARSSAKRGGSMLTLAFDEALDSTPAKPPTVIAIDDALHSLAAIDRDKARLIELRFFGGMTAEEIAILQSVSVHRVRHEMRLAMAWLHREVTS